MSTGATIKSMSLELLLRYDDGRWVANGNGLFAHGTTLDELDDALLDQLAAAGFETPVKVMMYFDHSSLPQWMRQYGAHYFNRVVQLNDDRAGRLQ